MTKKSDPERVVREIQRKICSALGRGAACSQIDSES